MTAECNPHLGQIVFLNLLLQKVGWFLLVGLVCFQITPRLLWTVNSTTEEQYYIKTAVVDVSVLKMFREKREYLALSIDISTLDSLQEARWKFIYLEAGQHCCHSLLHLLVQFC